MDGGLVGLIMLWLLLAAVTVSHNMDKKAEKLKEKRDE